MEVIAINLYKALKKYYTHLFNTGYSSEKDIEKLLVYSFIEEIFEYSLVPYIDDKDYTLIGEALNCLYGSTCVLPHPDVFCSCYFLSDTLNPLLNEPRKTENNLVRINEDSILRATEENTF